MGLILRPPLKPVNAVVLLMEQIDEAKALGLFVEIADPAAWNINMIELVRCFGGEMIGSDVLGLSWVSDVVKIKVRNRFFFFLKAHVELLFKEKPNTFRKMLFMQDNTYLIWLKTYGALWRGRFTLIDSILPARMNFGMLLWFVCILCHLNKHNSSQSLGMNDF